LGLLTKRAGKDAGALDLGLNRNAPARPGHSSQQEYCTTSIMRVKLRIRGEGKTIQKPQP